MKAYDVLRALGNRGDRVNVERRRIGGENSAWLGDLVELGENVPLQIHVFEHGFDDEIGL